MSKLKDFPDYQIMADGQVYSLLTNKYLRPKTNHCGYLVVSLKNSQGKYLSRKVHRLVVEAHKQEIPQELEVNHIDGDKTNNHIDNLEIVTSLENKRHAWDLGLYTHKGENHYASILPESTIRAMCEDMQDGLRNIDIVKKYKVNKHLVTNLRSGRTHKHITSQYTLTVRRKERKSPEVVEGICEMIVNGLSNKVIAEKYNIRANEVARIRNKETHKNTSSRYF